MMLKLITAAAATSMLTAAAFAQSNTFPSARLGTSVPQELRTVTYWYRTKRI